MSNINLNQDQEAAAQEVFQFLLSDDKECSISGPAGTGKTTLMHYIMRNLLPEYEQTCKLLGATPVSFEVVLTATTNKATEVLTQATGFPAQTIHSFLALKVFDDYQTGVSKISPRRDFKVHHNKLVFIDEASMVDAALYEYIHKGTDKSCKIIYLGDRCQMAPVFEKISPVYQKPRRTAELAIQMRNSGQPGLMALCDQLRRNVDALDFLPIPTLPGVVDHLGAAEAQAFIDSTFSQEVESSRVLCYTNQRVTEYNAHIRALRGYPDHFVAGERVINNVAAQIDPKILIRVEEDFEVRSCTETPETITIADGAAEMDIYRVKIANGRLGTILVKIPANRDHYKALTRFFAKEKNWSVYYWLRNNFPDLRPKDAATVYKAQGSTYETVFLDLANIGKCTDDDQVARMLYVGASRATTRLILYGQLPPRFQNRAPASLVAAGAS